MKSKKMIILATIAIVLIGLAYLSNTRRGVKTPKDVGQPVLPDLDLSRVHKIEFQNRNGEKLLIESSKDGWVIASLYNYPADITKIRSNLLAVKDLKIGQNAPVSTVSDAEELKIMDKSGKIMASLRIGDTYMSRSSGQTSMYGGGYPNGRYVSSGDKNKAYLVTDSLEQITESPDKWADTEIINISPNEVSKINIKAGDDDIHLTKADGTWTLEDLKENEEFDNSQSYSLSSALRTLSFQSLADPAMNEDDMGISTGVVFKVSLENGETYTAKLGNKPDNNSGYYMKISASFTPVGTNETENAEIQTNIDRLNKKLSQWNYIIPSYKAQNMMVSRSELIKEKEKEEDKEQED